MKRIILSLLLVILLSCPALSAPPTGIMSGLPYGAVYVPYRHELIASGTPPIIWQIGYGRLPSGLQLDPRTGVISGITGIVDDSKVVTGRYTFTAKATNAAGSVTKIFDINVYRP